MIKHKKITPCRTKEATRARSQKSYEKNKIERSEKAMLVKEGFLEFQDLLLDIKSVASPDIQAKIDNTIEKYEMVDLPRVQIRLFGLSNHLTIKKAIRRSL
jgi:hypothetical protein